MEYYKILPVLLLVFVLSLYSCHNSFIKEKRSVTIAPIFQENKFECTYNQNKQKCKEIYSRIEQHNGGENESRFVQFIADSLLPCWYGTKWDFNGTTETPGEGSIACGYFVTTVIRDAGISIQRIKMAQCASEEMIRKICVSESINRYSNVEIKIILNDIKKSGFGLYIIGLDNHTGFILNDGKEIYFIHSTYISPGCVIKEEAAKSAILIQSKYKVIGKLKI